MPAAQVNEEEEDGTTALEAGVAAFQTVVGEETAGALRAFFDAVVKDRAAKDEAKASKKAKLESGEAPPPCARSRCSFCHVGRLPRPWPRRPLWRRRPPRRRRCPWRRPL
jgi:hypothetical protein